MPSSIIIFTRFGSRIMNIMFTVANPPKDECETAMKIGECIMKKGNEVK